MPRYRENRLITPFSMLCAGISQNTRLHHLTVAKGHVRGKSYHKICDNNILNIVFAPIALFADDIMEENGELYVPPTPGKGFRDDGETRQDFQGVKDQTRTSCNISI